MRSSVSPITWRVRSWPVAVLIALAPLWLVGIFDRGLWTPDEPREADIAWRMSQQTDPLLPQLAGKPFLEKPPLSYWLSAAGSRAFDQPRAPNIVYAVVTAMAVGATAAAMADTGTAFLGALLAGSILMAFRVSVWLAPDACLLAGCALALAGAYAGYTAAPGRSKLSGYTLMHLGAAIGFMAKSAPGWLVPALALLMLIAWERKWSELLRIELYIGLAVQALIIGPWVYAVAASPGGHDALSTLFWHNIVGRFTKLPGPPALDYTTAHHNWPGKYFVELPVYLLPWTLLAVAALKRAWPRIRTAGPSGTPWRFAIAAMLPFLVILSLAATARDVYAAPAMLGMSLLIALWAHESQNKLTAMDRFALRGTRVLVAAIACVFAALLLLLAIADRLNYEPLDHLNKVIRIAAAAATIIVAAVALRFAARAQRLSNVHSAVVRTFGAYTGALCIAGIAAFPAIDRWQNLGLLADTLNYQTRDTSLALLDPDETTIAMLDYRLRTPSSILDTTRSDPAHVVSDWFRIHGKRSRVLVLLPGHAPGGVTRFLSRYHRIASPGDGVAGALATEGTASIVQRFELPQVRRYALLGPPAS
jgi:4-amino-4-deoxy-L-arabinose transferase-like glycosyltransferase